MKTIYQIKTGCVAGLLSVAVAAGAQEDKSKENNLNREMTLEREYDPTVQDAGKVNTLPEVKEPEVRKIPIDYAAFTVPAEPEKEIGLLPPGHIMAQMNYNKRRGYFNFGGGTYLNLNGDAGYHILRTDVDKLNVWFSHRSTNGKVKDLQGKEVKTKAKLNENTGGLDFRHAFDRAVLQMGVKYGYSAFNYYGYPMRFYPMMTGYSFDRTTMQGAQTIAAHVGVGAKEGASTGYLLDVDYTHFSYKHGYTEKMDGVTEQVLGALFDLNAAFNGNMRVGLGGQIRYFMYGIPDEMSGGSLWGLSDFDDFATVTLSPYYKAEGENWNVRLGANVMFYTGEGHKFMASPNIAADVEVTDRTVLYLTATGKLDANGMQQLASRNRYVNPGARVLPSRNWLNGRVGLKCGAAPGFWFDVFGGYKKTSNEVFFVPDAYLRAVGFTNFSTALSDVDADRAFGGVNLKYSYQELFDVSVEGIYNHWKVKGGDTWADSPNNTELRAFGKPKMEVNASLTVRPIRNLALQADYYLATDRYTTRVFEEEVKMKNINELNLTGTYTFNDTFGLYAKLNNVLNQRYELYYGYALQRFSAMVGVNINF